MNLYGFLLVVHIASGAVTLVSAAIAILARQLNWKHQLHKVSGSVFSGAMLLIFLTALPMSLLKFNLFLLLISVFSFYLMLSGWLYATDRQDTRSPVLLTVSSIMLAVSAAMIAFGMWSLVTGNQNGLVVLVFGSIGALLARADWRIARVGGAKGKKRITQHLTQMIGATIAAITAFLVNTVQLPGFWGVVLWLAPTALLVPVIVLQSRKQMQKA